MFVREIYIFADGEICDRLLVWELHILNYNEFWRNFSLDVD